MILKNLTRHSGNSQLFKYIFRYVFKEADLDTKPKSSYEAVLQELGIKFTDKDIRYLEAEKIDGDILAELRRSKYPENHKAFAQDYITHRNHSTGRSKEDGMEQTLAPLVLKHNVVSNTLEGFRTEFSENEAKRQFVRKDNVAINHTIISWSDKDKDNVTDDLLKETFNEFVRQRGDTNLYVGTVHREGIDHVHLHVAVSATNLFGRSSRMSKAEFHQLKVNLQEFQKRKFPNLIHSLPEHGKSKNRQAKIEKNRIGRSLVKNKLLSRLETINPKSTKHLLEELKGLGYTPYYRGAQMGIRHSSGFKFRLNRLPIDLAKLKELDRQEHELEALAKIRSTNSKTKMKSIEGLDTFSELQAIRYSKEDDREIDFERTREPEHEEDDNEDADTDTRSKAYDDEEEEDETEDDEQTTEINDDDDDN